MNEKIFLTGATGFIGSFLAERLLKEGYDVTFLARKSSDRKIIEKLGKKGAKAVFGDIKDKESLLSSLQSMPKQDMAIHLAAVHDANPKELMQTNVFGTKNVLDVCRQSGIIRFIHMSSATVYGKIKNGTESAICNPKTPYSRSKLEADFLVEKASREGMITTIIRPPIVYGNHKKASLIKWSKYIKKGYFFIFGNGKNKVEIVHVNDVVDSVILAIKSEKSHNQIYNISSKTTDMNELSALLAKLVHANKPGHIPVFLGKLFSFIVSLASGAVGKKSPLSFVNLSNMIRDRSIVCKKAEQELKFKPKISKEKGLKEMIGWAQENKLI